MNSEYLVSSCAKFGIMDGSVECFEYQFTPFLNSFYPSFYYSHKCGSEVIQAFTPVVINQYMTAIVFFIIELVLIVADYDISKLSWPLNICFGYLLHPLNIQAHEPIPSIQNKAAIDALVQAHCTIALHMRDFSMLLTFGFASPYAAVVICVNMILHYRRTVVVIWYYTLSHVSQSQNLMKESKIIDIYIYKSFYCVTISALGEDIYPYNKHIIYALIHPIYTRKKIKYV